MNQLPRSLARLGLGSLSTWTLGGRGRLGLSKYLHVGPTVLAPSALRVQKGKEVHWCSCGFSKKQPLCDGSHKSGNMTPLAFKSLETKDYIFCTCKRSGNKPFCDGSHGRVP